MSREHVTEAEILQRLRDFDPPGAWARPMDLGGSDGSNHSALLAKMAKRGTIERARRNTIANKRLEAHRSVAILANPNGRGVVFGASEEVPASRGTRGARGSWVYRIKPAEEAP